MGLLSDKHCEPCHVEAPALSVDEQGHFLKQLSDWSVVDNHLEKNYAIPDFASALAWTNTVGQIAEEQGHHPEIELGWGRVKLSVWTHKINSLTENDFIFAASVDEAERDNNWDRR